MALLGQYGEPFGKDRRVVVASSDKLDDWPEPRRALLVEVMVEALIEPLLVFAGREVDLRWTSRPSVALGYAVGGAPHFYIACEASRESWRSAAATRADADRLIARRSRGEGADLLRAFGQVAAPGRVFSEFGRYGG